MPASLYYVYRKRHVIVVFEFKCLFITVSYQYGCRVTNLKCVTSGDVRCGVAEYDPQSIWNPRENCRFFVDATSSES